MDWFLYDGDLRHERVKQVSFGWAGFPEGRTTQKCSPEESQGVKSFFC